MSPHAMTSLVSDLVEMAKAVERLPLVEHELDQANDMIEDYAKTIQRLEIKAHDYKAEIETLHSTIRSLEVAKDQAETMFLEADERTTRALDFIKSGFGAAGSLIQALEPAKVEPIIEPPINPPVNEPLPVSPALHEDAGQSEPDPTPVAIEREGSTGSVNETVTSTGTVSTQPEPPSGPYSGKLYIDVPGWVNREDWLAGGGTQYDYDWR